MTVVLQIGGIADRTLDGVTCRLASHPSSLVSRLRMVRRAGTYLYQTRRIFGIYHSTPVPGTKLHAGMGVGYDLTDPEFGE